VELSNRVTYADVTVTSKAADGQLPFETRCWLSTGIDDVDLNENAYLAILAEVTTGGKPVLGATVT